MFHAKFGNLLSDSNNINEMAVDKSAALAATSAVDNMAALKPKPVTGKKDIKIPNAGKKIAANNIQPAAELTAKQDINSTEEISAAKTPAEGKKIAAQPAAEQAASQKNINDSRERTSAAKTSEEIINDTENYNGEQQIKPNEIDQSMIANSPPKRALPTPPQKTSVLPKPKKKKYSDFTKPSKPLPKVPNKPLPKILDKTSRENSPTNTLLNTTEGGSNNSINEGGNLNTTKVDDQNNEKSFWDTLLFLLFGFDEGQEDKSLWDRFVNNLDSLLERFKEIFSSEEESKTEKLSLQGKEKLPFVENTQRSPEKTKEISDNPNNKKGEPSISFAGDIKTPSHKYKLDINEILSGLETKYLDETFTSLKEKNEFFEKINTLRDEYKNKSDDGFVEFSDEKYTKLMQQIDNIAKEYQKLQSAEIRENVADNTTTKSQSPVLKRPTKPLPMTSSKLLDETLKNLDQLSTNKYLNEEEKTRLKDIQIKVKEQLTKEENFNKLGQTTKASLKKSLKEIEGINQRATDRKNAKENFLTKIETKTEKQLKTQQLLKGFDKINEKLKPKQDASGLKKSPKLTIGLKGSKTTDDIDSYATSQPIPSKPPLSFEEKREANKTKTRCDS
jgi:hypothetical protein